MARRRPTLERLLPGPEAGVRAGDAGRDGLRPADPARSVDLVPPALGAVLACRGRPPIAAEYAKLVGMRTSCRGKGLHGTAITWETHAFPGSAAFVVEMPPGKISGGSADRQARAALTVAEGR